LMDSGQACQRNGVGREKERGEGIGPIWSNAYPPTPFQLEGGARS